MTPADFARLISEAGERVTVGAEYTHYKSPEKRYRVENLAIDEESEGVRVVYRPLYGEELLWIRTLDNFLDTVETPDGPKPRFARA
jgi:hypothetical protein